MNEYRDEMACYCSLWLRCWQAGRKGPGQESDWRFSLEDPETGHKQGFSNLEELVAYLKTEVLIAAPDFARVENGKTDPDRAPGAIRAKE